MARARAVRIRFDGSGSSTASMVWPSTSAPLPAARSAAGFQAMSRNLSGAVA